MRCPRCGETLLSTRGDLYECPMCSYLGTFREVTEFTGNIRKIDALIEVKDAEKERLLDARREAVIKGNTFFLKKVLNGITQNKPIQSPHSGTRVPKNSFRSKLGLMLASAELGAFMSWLMTSFHGLMDGQLPLTQGVVPLIFLFQSVILLVVSWK